MACKTQKFYSSRAKGIKVFIHVVSSDVGASGANIFYSMMDGNYTIILGEALRIKHQYKRGLEEFTCSMGKQPKGRNLWA